MGKRPGVALGERGSGGGSEVSGDREGALDGRREASKRPRDGEAAGADATVWRDWGEPELPAVASSLSSRLSEEVVRALLAPEAKCSNRTLDDDATA